MKIKFENRVIMGGLPRSGSSLLRIVLNGHPNIISLSELSLYTLPFARLFECPIPKNTFKAFSNRIEIKSNIILKYFNNYNNRIELYDNLMNEYIKKYNIKNINTWIQKTPSNCHYYEYINKRHPNILFLSIIRDGRNVVTSKMENKKRYQCSIDRYIKSMEDIYSFNSKNHIIIKYEDFIENKEKTIKTILNFIELEWYENIFKEYLNAKGIGSPEKKTKKEITDKWLNRWKNKEYQKRIENFYKNEKAVYWLEKSGYKK